MSLSTTSWTASRCAPPLSLTLHAEARYVVLFSVFLVLKRAVWVRRRRTASHGVATCATYEPVIGIGVRREQVLLVWRCHGEVETVSIFSLKIHESGTPPSSACGPCSRDISFSHTFPAEEVNCPNHRKQLHNELQQMLGITLRLGAALG